MQAPRDKVMIEYRKALVDKDKGFTEPDDHVAIELQFMAILCGKTEEALKGGQKGEARKFLETQKDFLNNHILLWVPELADNVIKTPTVDFYKATAMITKEFLEVDKEAIADLIQGLENMERQAPTTNGT